MTSVWTRRQTLKCSIPALAGWLLPRGAFAQTPRSAAASACLPLKDWNSRLLTAVRGQTPPPCLVTRMLALAHMAAWSDRTKDQVLQFPDSADELLFHSLFPNTPLPDSFPAAAESRMAAVRKLLASRADDGSSTTIHYVPQKESGQWRRTPPGFRPPEAPHWAKVRPFLLKSPDQFRPPAPPSLSSPESMRELDEVRRLGSKENSQRTAAETESARFWSDFSYTASPPGHWNEIACQLAVTNRLELKEGLKLLAMLNLALADAAIACWDCKYHYNYWRPVTALNQDQAPPWEPLLPSPPHPDHVSGHSVFTGAAVAVLQAFFGTDRLSFSATSDTVKDKVRHYRSLRACADEISRSRVFGGIHFSVACREGLLLGTKIGEWTFRHF